MKKMLFLLFLMSSAACLAQTAANKILDGIKVAILVTDGFEQSEMTEPRKALDQVGAKTYLIAPHIGKIKSWSKNNWANEFVTDLSLATARAENYDALVLPGGVINPDTLRIDKSAVAFVKKFVDAGKPIAAICHGPWTLINAGGVKGRTVTSWPSLEIDLKNGGANWVDKQVVRDKNLVTSRKPEDIPAFNKEMIKLFSEQTVLNKQ